MFTMAPAAVITPPGNVAIIDPAMILVCDEAGDGNNVLNESDSILSESDSVLNESDSVLDDSDFVLNESDSVLKVKLTSHGIRHVSKRSVAWWGSGQRC